MIKRFFDITFSLVGIMICLPLYLLIALLIVIDSKGGVFFVQQRVGKDGRHFGIIKFRTMITGAEKIGTGLDSFSDDPRVTKLGKFLRASSLDEIPQLFNILKGDMSFVGPRPPTTYHPYKFEDYPEDKKVRFNVKPGVTGWAQINGRNNLTWDEKIKFDREYLDRQSFWFDLKIILVTLIKVIKNEGAYDSSSNKK